MWIRVYRKENWRRKGSPSKSELQPISSSGCYPKRGHLKQASPQTSRHPPNSKTPTFMALKSFFIFSGIPVIKESSGNSRISPFSSLDKKTERKRVIPGPTQDACRSAITNLPLRNFYETPRERTIGQETLHVFCPPCPLSHTDSYCVR